VVSLPSFANTNRQNEPTILIHECEDASRGIKLEELFGYSTMVLICGSFYLGLASPVFLYSASTSCTEGIFIHILFPWHDHVLHEQYTDHIPDMLTRIYNTNQIAFLPSPAVWVQG
jgi:hypothetical protein